MELIALDGNLKRIGTIQFKSLIWIDRYNRVGSCEIYAPATPSNLALCQEGNFIKRTDKRSVFQVKCFQVSGNEDTGEFIAAYAYDTKRFLDQRINTSVQAFQSQDAGNDLALILYDEVLGAGAANPFRKANGGLLFATRPPVFVSGICNQSIRNMGWGEVTRHVCGSLDFGYYVELVDSNNPGGRQLRLVIYKGQDVSASVRIGKTFGNLGAESYVHDTRNKGNVILAKSEDDPRVAIFGEGQGVNRVERFCESTAAIQQTLGELRDLIEGTISFRQVGSGVLADASNLYIPILSDWQLEELRLQYPSGSTSQRDGYFYVAGPAWIATAQNTQLADVTDNTVFTVGYGIFDMLLLLDAAAEAEQYEAVDESSVEIVNNRFVYGTDYNLGDIVLIQPKYSATRKARIVEVLECWDENGYRLEPRTSYSEEQTA